MLKTVRNPGQPGIYGNLDIFARNRLDIQFSGIQHDPPRPLLKPDERNVDKPAKNLSREINVEIQMKMASEEGIEIGS